MLKEHKSLQHSIITLISVPGIGMPTMQPFYFLNQYRSCSKNSDASQHQALAPGSLIHPEETYI